MIVLKAKAIIARATHKTAKNKWRVAEQGHMCDMSDTVYQKVLRGEISSVSFDETTTEAFHVNQDKPDEPKVMIKFIPVADYEEVDMDEAAMNLKIKRAKLASKIKDEFGGLDKLEEMVNLSKKVAAMDW